MIARIKKAIERHRKGDLRVMQERIAANNFAKGWRGDDQPVRTLGEDVALIHSEVSEALEEYRNGHDPSEIYFMHDKKCPIMPGRSYLFCSDCIPKPEGVPIEFADVLVRLLDAADIYGFDLDKAVKIKMAYNETRPFRHGGKAL